MKNISKKKLERRIKRKNKKRLSYQINHKNDYNIKFGEIYQRIHFLLNLAIKLYNDNESLSSMYVSIMKDIIKKNALRADSKFKKLICKTCNNLIFIDKNTDVKFESKLFFFIIY